MNYDEYYQRSRGYNWNDMRELRRQPKPASLVVPTMFQHMFSDRASYDAWVAEQRKRYFS